MASMSDQNQIKSNQTFISPDSTIILTTAIGWYVTVQRDSSDL
jgi:hypothetical protein